MKKYNVIALLMITSIIMFTVYGSQKTTRDPFIITKKVSHKPLKKPISQVITLHYLQASKAKKIVSDPKNHLLSNIGNVIMAEQNNQIWVYDYPGQIKKIKQLIQDMDNMAPRQVLIQARIVNIDEDYLRELGLKFGSTQSNSFSHFQAGKVKLALLHLTGRQRLDAELDALAQQGKAQIIASPHLITENRTPAIIESGEEIPYQEKTSSGATNVAFKKAVLSLHVIPTLMEASKLLLNITMTQNKLSHRLIQGVPGIQTQELKTQVLAENQKTIVLGGVYTMAVEREMVKLPLLGDLPLLGRLFQHHKLRQRRRLLLVFITPTILPVN